MPTHEAAPVLIGRDYLYIHQDDGNVQTVTLGRANENGWQELPFADDPPVREPVPANPFDGNLLFPVEDSAAIDPDDEYHDVMHMTEHTNIYVHGLTYYEIRCNLMGYIHEADVVSVSNEKMHTGDIMIILETGRILLGYNGEVISIPKAAYHADVCYMSVSDGWNEGLRKPLSATITVNASDVCVVWRPDDGTVGTAVPFATMDQAFDDVYT